MLGNLDFSQKKATVVGGGVAGLLLSYQIAKLGFETQLIEKSARLGGLIQTTHTEYGLSESAAHSFLLSPAVEALLQELELNWVELNQGSKSRYIFRDEKMRRFPLKPSELAKLAMRFFLNRANGTVQSTSLQTLEDWGNFYLGKGATDYLLAPALLGIYAARPSELSVQAVLGEFSVPKGSTLFSALLRRQKNSKATKKKKMVALSGGMESLTQALEKKLRALPNVTIKTSTAFNVKEHLNSPNLALCVPANVAASILEEVHPDTSAALAKIRYAPLHSATLFFNEKSFVTKPKGVGVLFPERANQQVLGVLFNSSSFLGRVKSPDLVSITGILGGTLHPELVGKEPAMIENAILECLKPVFGMREKPLKIVHHPWPKAIPLYDQELLNAWSVCRKGWCSKLGNILFGNYVGALSVRGIIESTALIQSKNIKSV